MSSRSATRSATDSAANTVGAQRQVAAVLFHAAGGHDGHPARGEQPGGVRLGHPLDLAVGMTRHGVSLHIRG